METGQINLLDLVKAGKIEGMDSIPKMIETVISRVFIFDAENVVLKFYKRDNEWWNTNMRDISNGQPRFSFIRQDFGLNQFLNPAIYVSLKKAMVERDQVKLVEAVQDDDELVIVMRKEKADKTFTQILHQGKLTPTAYEDIGAAFARARRSIPKEFLPDIRTSWYEQIKARMDDVAEWARSEALFPAAITEKAVAFLNKTVDQHKEHFQAVGKDDLHVLIDCNSENLIYADRELRFLDVYPPKEEWRIGTHELDIFRVGADIRVLAGEDAYASFMKGVERILGNQLSKNFEQFYLVYAAMIAGPYLFMLSRKDGTYLELAKKYLAFVERMVK